LEGFTLVSNEPDLLLAEANKLDVDVLCWGGTHRFDAFEYMDKFFVNPGSATGAFTTGWSKEGEEPVPSFCLMDVGTPDLVAEFSEEKMADVNLSLGSRNIINPIRVSTKKRRQRQRECGRRESYLHETRGALGRRPLNFGRIADIECMVAKPTPIIDRTEKDSVFGPGLVGYSHGLMSNYHDFGERT
jgi:hypothetical protein